MRRHGDYFDEEPEPLYEGDERLLFQAGPFSDFRLRDGYHYGKLATGPSAGRWVRLADSPAAMGLIADG